jgi:ribonuclease D
MNRYFPSSIVSEAVSQLPYLQFPGRIIVADTLSSMKVAIKMLDGHSILGFDTETKPSFKKGRQNKVCMVQLSNNESCVIFRLNKIGFPDELAHIFSNPSITKIGLSLKDDFRELSKLRHFHHANFVELQTYVELFGITDKSLKKLAALVLHGRISKSQQTSNWESELLTEAQLIYAATDAWACLEIYKKMKAIEVNHKTSSPDPSP